MGRGRGGRGSGGTGSASVRFIVIGDVPLPVDFDIFDIDIEYEFDIYSLREDGETPTTFSEAIENFGLEVSQDEPLFDFTALDFQADSPLNLQARFITAGEPITLDGQPLTNVDFFGGGEDLVANSDRIEYRFLNEELTAAGVDEFTIAIEDDNTEQPGFQVDGQTIDVALATASGGISESDAIDYIITEELFASVDLSRVSGGSIDDPSQITSVELFLDNDEDNPTEFTAFTPEAVDDSATTEVNTPVTIDVLANDNVGFIESFDINSSQGGTVTLDDNGTPDDSNDDLLAYTPAAGFLGSDSFDYTISNGSDTSTATVTVEVSAPEDPVSTIFGTDLSDFLSGTEENDTIVGLGGSDFIRGNGGNDNLTGNGGQDFLVGGDGDDLLMGGTGLDLLRGNAGSDTFIFGRGDGTDFVQDFELGIDKIGLIEGELSFADLSIINAGFTTFIGVADTGEILAAIQKTSGSGELTEDMFVTVADI